LGDLSSGRVSESEFQRSAGQSLQYCGFIPFDGVVYNFFKYLPDGI